MGFDLRVARADLELIHTAESQARSYSFCGRLYHRYVLFGRALVGRCFCSIHCIEPLSQMADCFLPEALVLTVICEMSVDTQSHASLSKDKCQLKKWEAE